MGMEQPDKGTFEVGSTVKIAYVDQQHKAIDPEKTVYQVISGGSDLINLGGREVNARAYVCLLYTSFNAGRLVVCSRCILSGTFISG